MTQYDDVVTKLINEDKAYSARSRMFNDGVENPPDLTDAPATAQAVVAFPSPVSDGKTWEDMGRVEQAWNSVNSGLHSWKKGQAASSAIENTIRSEEGLNVFSDDVLDAVEGDEEAYKGLMSLLTEPGNGANKAFKQKAVKGVIDDVRRFKELQAQDRLYKAPEAMIRASQAAEGKGLMEGLSAAAGEIFSGDVLGNLIYLTGTSTGAMLPYMAMSAATGGAIGSAGRALKAVGESAKNIGRMANAARGAVFTAGSYQNEFGQYLLDEMERRGLDPKEIESYRAILGDQYAEFERSRGARATGVSAFDGISAAIAPVRLDPAEGIRKLRTLSFLPEEVNGINLAGGAEHQLMARKRFIKAPEMKKPADVTPEPSGFVPGVRSIATQTVVQGALGGAGEYVGTTAAGGEVNAADVLMEMIGEFSSAPLEVFTHSMTSVNEYRKEVVQAKEAKEFDETTKKVIASQQAIAGAVQDQETLNQWAERIGKDSTVVAFAQDLVDSGQIEGIKKQNPELAAKIEEAAQKKESVVLPVSEVVKIANTDAKLAEDIVYDSRVNVDGMTPRQAEEFEKNGRKEAEAKFERIIAKSKIPEEHAKQARQIARDIAARLETTGASKDLAKTQAMAWQAMLTMVCRETGNSPDEIMSRVNLSIAKRTANGVKGGLVSAGNAVEQGGGLPYTVNLDGQELSAVDSEGNYVGRTDEEIRAFYRWFKAGSDAERANDPAQTVGRVDDGRTDEVGSQRVGGNVPESGGDGNRGSSPQPQSWEVHRGVTSHRRGDRSIFRANESRGPIVFFHGASSVFDEVQIEHKGKVDSGYMGKGFYLTTNKDHASLYALRKGMKNGTSGAIMSMYARVNNPAEVSPEFFKEMQNLSSDKTRNFISNEFRDRLISEGYDSAYIVKKDGGKTYYEVVVFDPAQVKAARSMQDEQGRPNTGYRADSSNMFEQGAVDRGEDGRVPYGPAVRAHIGRSKARKEAVDNLLKLMSTEHQKEFVVQHQDSMQITYQKNINDAVQRAAKKAGVDLSDTESQVTRDLIVTTIINDALYAVNVNPTAIGWYDEKVRKCLAYAGLMFPELDPANPEFSKNDLFRFLYITATTSNGLKVKQNMNLAVRIYREYKKTGVMPAWGEGTQMEPMVKTLEDFVKTQGTFDDLDQMRKFFTTDWTVGQLLLMGYSISGEGKNETARGAAIIGPKIGNGFFSNLNGIFDALTMDRWFMRTFGRWTGTLIDFNREGFIEKVNNFRAILREVKKNKALCQWLKDNAGFDVEEALKDKMTPAAMAKAEMSLTDQSSPFVKLVKKTATVFMPASYRKEYGKLWGTKDEPESIGWRFYSALKAVERAAVSDKVAPGGSGERRYIRGLFNAALDVLHGIPGIEKLTMADLQAVLWYAEKKIYEATPVGKEFVEDYSAEDAPDYANVMRDIAKANGATDEQIKQAAKRVDDAIEAERSQGSERARYDSLDDKEKVRVFGSRSFGSLRSDKGLSVEDDPKQNKRGKTVYRDERTVEGAGVRAADGTDSGGLSASDSGKTGRNGGSVRVLKPIATWKPGSRVSAVLKANQSIKGRDEKTAAPAFLEYAPTEQAANEFLTALKAAKKTLGYPGACVEEKSVEELTGNDEWKSQCRIFLSKDKQCGFVIKNGDDLVSVFSAKGSNSGDAIVECAIAAGARRLDCFNTILPRFYALHGFVPVAKLKFNREYAPYDWNYEYFSEFNGGEPEIVFMVYDNSRQSSYKKEELDSVPYTDGEAYGEPYVTEAVKRLKETNKVVEESVEEARKGKDEEETEDGADGFNQAPLDTLVSSGVAEPVDGGATLEEKAARQAETAADPNDKAYFEAIAKGDTAAVEKMVADRAKENGFADAIPEQTEGYSVRTTPPPKKTIKAYKVFYVNPQGEPTTLFVGGAASVPRNVWINANSAYHFQNPKNGLFYVPTMSNPNRSEMSGKRKNKNTGESIPIPNDEVRAELLRRGFIKKKDAANVTCVAFRPGWHAGTLPYFPQGGKAVAGSNYGKVHEWNQVVFEVEIDADKDYTPEARSQAKAFTKAGKLDVRKADLQYMPEGGMYYYTTNPMLNAAEDGWVITASMKIVRAVPQEECDAILANAGKLPQEWEQGRMDLTSLGVTDATASDAHKKTLAPVTYDENGDIIALSERFDPNSDSVLRQSDPLYQVAYHGSPYKFDKFTLSHIGSGEGAQAHGWGLYFALDKRVAQNYREALTEDAFDEAQLREYVTSKLNVQFGISTRNVSDANDILDFLTMDDEEYNASELDTQVGNEWIVSSSSEYAGEPDAISIEEFRSNHGNIDSATAAALRYAIDEMYSDFDPKTADQIVEGAVDEFGEGVRDALQTFLADYQLKDYGRVYEVEIPEDNVMLREDALYDEQPEAVRNAIDELFAVTPSTAASNYIAMVSENIMTSNNDEIVDRLRSFAKEYYDAHDESRSISEDKREYLKDKENELREFIRDSFSKNGMNRYAVAAIITNHYLSLIEQSAAGERLYGEVAKVIIKDITIAVRHDWGKDHPEFDYKEMTGREILGAVEDKNGGPEAAANAFKSKGVLGIRYRGGIDGECAVVWSEEAIQIRDYLEQSLKSGPRGTYHPINSINADKSLAGMIEMMETSDRSTFLHESAHAWLDIYTLLALAYVDKVQAGEQLTAGEMSFLRKLGGFFQWGQREGAIQLGVTDDVKSIVAGVQKWSGMTINEQRKMHELFAEGFESYLMTGEAPSNDLIDVFRKFRAWLLDVYSKLANSPKPLSPEVKKLYDLLFVSEQEAADAEARAGLEPLFGDKVDEALMNEEEKRQYQELAAKANQETQGIISKAIAGVMRVYARIREKTRREIMKQYKDRVAALEAELVKEPRHIARAILKSGYTPEGGQTMKTKLSASAMLKAGIQQSTIDSLAKKGFVAENGASPEQLAAMCGHNNATELIGELLDIETPNREATSIVAAQVKQETGEGIESYSRLQADLAAHNETRSRLLTAEYNAIARKLGKRQLLVGAARKFALEKIGSMKLSDVTPYVYERDEKRCAREAEAAFRKGDFERCLEMKRAQILNHEMARAALEVEDAVTKGERRVKRAMRSKTLYAAYQQLLCYIAKRHGIKGRMAVKDVDAAGALKVAVALREDGTPVEGITPSDDEIPTLLTLEKDVDDMTADEALLMFDSLRQLERLGRDRMTVIKNGIRESAKETIEELRTEFDANADAQKRPIAMDERDAVTRLQKAKDILQRFFYAHIKISTWCRIFDGNRDGGPWWNAFIRSANDRADWEEKERAKAAKRIQAILVPLFKGKPMFESDKVKIGSKMMSKGERIAVALNMGNASNLQRLVDGDPRQWTAKNLEALQASLTEEEWRAVQQIWDLFEEYRPLIAEKEKRIYGIEPEWIPVEPIEVVLKDKKRITLRGGYYPVVYDTKASLKANMYDQVAKADQEMKGAYQSATTRRSFVKKRVAEVHDRPLRLNLDALYNGIGDVIHDLAWHEWLINTKRLLDGVDADGGLREDIKARYGMNVVKQFEEWRIAVAAGDRSTMTPEVRAALRWASGNVGLTAMGFSPSSAIMQLTGIGYIVPRCGPVHTAAAVKDILSSRQLWSDIAEKSTLMRNRAINANRMISDMRNRLDSGREGIVKKYAYVMLLGVQGLVDRIAWQAGYRKAIAEGFSESDAVALADQTVIDTQSSGRKSDLASVERSEYLGPFTVFYSWANSALNVTYASVKGEDSKAKKLAVIMWAGMVMPMLDSLLRDCLKVESSGDDDGEDDWLKKWILMPAGKAFEYHLGLFIISREVANAAGNMITGDTIYDYGGPAGVRGIGTVVNTFKEVGRLANGKEMNRVTWDTLCDLLGVTIGAPANQLKKAGKTYAALESGDIEPYEVPQALAFGVSGRVGQ